MKLVGDAVRQGQFYIQDKGNQSMSRGLKLIGLTSWGYVKNNMNLINTGAKYFGVFSSCSIKTREKYISFAQ